MYLWRKIIYLNNSYFDSLVYDGKTLMKYFQLVFVSRKSANRAAHALAKVTVWFDEMGVCPTIFISNILVAFNLSNN